MNTLISYLKYFLNLDKLKVHKNSQNNNQIFTHAMRDIEYLNQWW